MKYLFSTVIMAAFLFSSFTFAMNDNTTIYLTENGIKGVIQAQHNVKTESFDQKGMHSPIEFSVSNDLLDTISASIKYQGNHYALLLNQVKKQVKITGTDINNKPLINTPALRADIKNMLHDVELNSGLIMKSQSTLDKESKLALLKFFEFLSTYPLGEAIDQQIESKISAQDWTDLCAYMGKSKTAVWDITNSSVKTRNYIVGGHGFCAARCGAGCPMFGDGQYTQDCLNHDACADVEGEQLGVCGDEWTSASDDFWFSPDCTTPPPSLR